MPQSLSISQARGTWQLDSTLCICPVSTSSRFPGLTCLIVSPFRADIICSEAFYFPHFAQSTSPVALGLTSRNDDNVCLQVPLRTTSSLLRTGLIGLFPTALPVLILLFYGYLRPCRGSWNVLFLPAHQLQACEFYIIRTWDLGDRTVRTSPSRTPSSPVLFLFRFMVTRASTDT